MQAALSRDPRAGPYDLLLAALLEVRIEWWTRRAPRSRDSSPLLRLAGWPAQAFAIPSNGRRVQRACQASNLEICSVGSGARPESLPGFMSTLLSVLVELLWTKPGSATDLSNPLAKTTKGSAVCRLTPRRTWLRGLDLNQRPLGYERLRGCDGNPLILRRKLNTTPGSTLCDGAACWCSFQLRSGCCGRKMGADANLRHSVDLSGISRSVGMKLAATRPRPCTAATRSSPRDTTSATQDNARRSWGGVRFEGPSSDTRIHSRRRLAFFSR